MYNPLTLTWEEVLAMNTTTKQKSNNRRIQITFIKPSHHDAGGYMESDS
jgi:hypothetical protein